MVVDGKIWCMYSKDLLVGFSNGKNALNVPCSSSINFPSLGGNLGSVDQSMNEIVVNSTVVDVVCREKDWMVNVCRNGLMKGEEI